MSGKRTSPKFDKATRKATRPQRVSPRQKPSEAKQRNSPRKSPKKAQVPPSPRIARRQGKKRRIPFLSKPRERGDVPAGGFGSASVRKPKELNDVTLLRFQDETKQVTLPQGFDNIVFEMLGNVGFASSVLIEMLWLLRIHKNACLISSEFAQSGRNRFDTISIDWVCVQDKSLAQFSFAFKTKDKVETDFKNRILKIPKGFQTAFLNCVNNPQIRFVIIPIRFIHLECRQGINAATETRHANMVLYDKKTKTVERFEPWGFLDLYDNNEFDKEFSKWLLFSPENAQLPIENYLGATEICPREGFQFLQERTSFGALSGEEESKFYDLLAANDDFFNKVQSSNSPNMIINFCSIWSNWYANLRMTNPSIAPARVIEESIKLLKKDPRGMSSFILRYASFIRSEAFKIFKEIGIDFDIRENFLKQFDENTEIDRIISKVEKELETRIANI